MSVALITRLCYRCASTASKYSRETRALLDPMLRVDHAGEYGAVRIYKGQLAVLGNTKVGPVLEVGVVRVIVSSIFQFDIKKARLGKLLNLGFYPTLFKDCADNALTMVFCVAGCQEKTDYISETVRYRKFIINGENYFGCRCAKKVV